VVIPQPQETVIETGPWSSRPANDNVRLRLAYAFNHCEALRAFRKARTLDPNCAICLVETQESTRRID